MKKIMSLTFALIMLFAMGASFSALAATNAPIPIANATDLQAALNDQKDYEGQVFELTADIVLDSQLAILNSKNIVIDGKGKTISGSATFDVTPANRQREHLVHIVKSENVTLKNIALKAGEKNKHTLNVYDAIVTLDGVSLDHAAATSGAPLINSTSQVTVKGEFKIVTGEKSWYAMNIENKSADGTSETFIKLEENANLSVSGNEKIAVLQIDGEKESEFAFPATSNLVEEKDENGKVTYREKIAVTKIVLKDTPSEIKKGTSFDLATVKITLEPTNTDFAVADVVWSSSDASVAKVENGKIVAVKEGKATITATLNGVTASFEVTVPASKNPAAGENNSVEIALIGAFFAAMVVAGFALHKKKIK